MFIEIENSFGDSMLLNVDHIVSAKWCESGNVGLKMTDNDIIYVDQDQWEEITDGLHIL